jgi:NTP pyrophosphatase (non-canonical NTP hydrolase)
MNQKPGYTARLAWFFEAMVQKLDHNAHKRDWRFSRDVNYFHIRIHQELEELKRAIDRGASPEEVTREAADVANFAMMIADVYRMAHQEHAAKVASLPPGDR